MNTSMHVPFGQLPIEARVLFAIYASGALARYRSTPPVVSTLTAELGAIWNANRLTLRHLSDPYRMTALLESHFAALLVDEGENGNFLQMPLA
jgi:hypothetical protein